MKNNNSIVSTWMDPLGRSNIQIGFEVFFAVIICLASLLGNALVAFVINKDAHLKNITNVFIHNLAWTDILMGSFVMPFWIVSLTNGRWILSTEMCQWVAVGLVTFGTTSVWSMAVIAVNRYLKVVKPNLYPKLFPGIKMARVYCGIAWLMGVFSATPPLYGWGKYAYHRDVAVCNFVWDTEGLSTILFFSIIFCGVLNLILLCYYKIYQKVKVSSANLASHAQNSVPDQSHNGDASQTPANTKLLKTTFAVVCAYTVCYAPLAAISLYKATGGSPPRLPSMIFMVLTFCSSAVNPFIYGLMNPPLKRAFVKVLKCHASQQQLQDANQAGDVQGVAPGTQRALPLQRSPRLDEARRQIMPEVALASYAIHQDYNPVQN